MEHKMTFNGVRKEYVTTLRGKRRPAWAPLTRNLVTIPGMPGAHNLGTQVEPLRLSIPIVIESASLAQLKVMKEDLADWLVTDEPKPLIFDDEPNRVYYAMVEGGFDPDEIVRVGYGVIQFVCIDPHKYSTTTEIETLNQELNMITNTGTAPTYPLFRATILQPITNLDIITEDAYMRVGEAHSVETTPYEKETLVMHDDMSSLTGWSDSLQVDNGYVAGVMATDGQGFYNTSWGSPVYPRKWQGPSKTRDLPTTVQDFKMEAMVEINNSIGVTAMLEVYLLNSAGAVVGKIGLSDELATSTALGGKARAGTADDGNWLHGSERYKEWQNFKGMIRLRREDNKWYVYYALVDSKGKHNFQRGSQDNLMWIDTHRKYMDPIAQVQVAFRINVGGGNPSMRVNDIKVYEINPTPSPERVPYIAHAGDIIEIDHKTNEIRINGESRIDLKDFGSTYFPLKKGNNLIQYAPPTAATVEIEWKERYK